MQLQIIPLICLVSFYNYVPSEANIFSKGVLAIKASFTKTNPKNQTTFHLFTRKNPTTSQILNIDNETSFAASNFNHEWQTRILIHGYQADGDSKMAKTIRDAYLKRGDFNVISIDWSPISRKFGYNAVVRKLKGVSEVIAEFTTVLYKILNIPYHDMYLIGHSLGAQIAGLVGRRIAPHQFNTIFALDPASPKFKGIVIEDRIDMTDAAYVESIQTDIYNLGYKEPVGHASFYPNYGKTQFGCTIAECISRFTCNFGCSHRRSYKYFAESIYSTIGFGATKCNNFDEILNSKCTSNSTDYRVSMGGEPSIPKYGVFYVPTEYNSPFAKGF